MSIEYQVSAKKIDFGNIARRLAQQGYCLSASGEQLEVVEEGVPVMSIHPHNGGAYVAWHGGMPSTHDSLLGAVLRLILADSADVTIAEL